MTIRVHRMRGFAPLEGGAALALVLATTACSDRPSPVSTDIETADLRLAFVLEAGDAATTLSGTLLGPKSVAVRLVEGDRLVLEDATRTFPVSAEAGKFDARLPPLEGAVALRLVRPPERGVGVTETTYVPRPFEVRAPTTLRLSEGFVVTWNAFEEGDYSTEMSLSGPCILQVARSLAFDSGTYRFDPGTLVERSSDAAASGCEVVVEVRKTSPAVAPGTYRSASAVRVGRATVQVSR
jgi:hypothetical protein